MAILVRKPQRAEALLPWMRALVLAHTAYFIASPGERHLRVFPAASINRWNTHCSTKNGSQLHFFPKGS